MATSLYEYQYRLGGLTSWAINSVVQEQKTYNEIGWMLTRADAAETIDYYTYNNMGSPATHTDKMEQKYAAPPPSNPTI